MGGIKDFSKEGEYYMKVGMGERQRREKFLGGFGGHSPLGE